MPENTFLIYGANGFTGALIAARARDRGLHPVVAGRSREDVEAVGARLGLPVRVFDLASPDAIDEGIRGVRLVLHCAGPYSKTSRPMVDACLRAGVHYLDITGETAVLEAILARDGEARAANVVLLPAVGFDVVPTDCMATRLHATLPDAISLELAFSGGQMSPGTAKTAVEGLAKGALVRQDGKLVALPGPRTREIPFHDRPRFDMSLPWGDLVTGFHSTGIPNITVYMRITGTHHWRVARWAPMLRFAAPVLRMPSTIAWLQKSAGKRAVGPTEQQRKTGRTAVWGRVENAAGLAVEGHLDVPEVYELTVLASLESVARVLRGDVTAGSTTPSRAFGADFVTTLPGSGPFVITR